MKGFLIFVGILIAFLALTWVMNGNEFFLYKYFAPKKEQVRREVFEQTKSYVQGTIQILYTEHMEFIKSDSAGKEAIASIVLGQTCDFDKGLLPPDLRVWVDSLERSRY